MSARKVYLIAVLGILGTSACATSTPARNPQAVVDPALATKSVEERLKLGAEARMKMGLGFGYVAAIREEGKTKTYAYGKKTLEPVKGLLPKDSLEIGSVSKAFTGILLELAAEEGLLRLDQRLEDFFSELRGKATGQITLRDLGLHQSGLLREPEGVVVRDILDPRRDLKKDEVLASLARFVLPPLPEGSTEYKRSYSNWGYLILGIVLESVYHHSYSELARTRVLRPLGMLKSGVDLKKKASPGFSLSASRLNLRTYASFAAATGGIESNAIDMGKFLHALENPPSGKLGRALKASMESGIGWDSKPGVNLLWKNGATTAHTAILVFDREKKKGIYVGSNTMVLSDDLGFFALGVDPRDTLFDSLKPERVVSAEELGWLEGTFVNPKPVRISEKIPGLKEVRVFETFGNKVLEANFEGFIQGALFSPAGKTGFWKVIDGVLNSDHARVYEDGLDIIVTDEAGKTIEFELKRTEAHTEKYPALE